VNAVKNASQNITTIGPVAPPKNFDLVAFADYIGSLRTDAATQGWVRAGADMSAIDALQAQVRSQLASQSYSAARTSGASYVSAVQTAACTDFDCPASKAMTAEAGALLALNMSYLLSQIPAPAVLQTGPASVWLGLKNSDDQGTQFDVRASLYANGTLIAQGTTLCVTGITRNATNAKNVSIPFDASTGSAASGATLQLQLDTRIGTNPDGTKCAGHNNAVGLRLYYDGSGRASAFGAALGGGDVASYFLHSTGTSFTLDRSAPTAASPKQQDSAAVNFASGNPWVTIGSWSLVVP
jgi:hypothetical protein